MTAIAATKQPGKPGKGRERFEYAIPYTEWTSPAHGALTTTATTAPDDLRRFKYVTVKYVNGTDVSVIITPTAYAYSDAAGAWSALAAGTAQTMTTGTGKSFMIKPIFQDNSTDPIWAGDGVVWSVDPDPSTPTSGTIRIIVEGVLYDNAK